MKKIVLLLVMLPFLAVAVHAQESRQDVSMSASGFYFPFRTGNTVHQNATLGIGGLASYRYMLTPRSALEANYQYAQDYQKYVTSFNSIRVHSRIQELSAAYVFNFSYRHFNPFVEGGIGGFMFSPIASGTTDFDPKRATQIGALYGGGIAYEISPSFDIRAEYRGQVMKTPSFGLANYKTNRWYTPSNPVIGIAYHF